MPDPSTPAPDAALTIASLHRDFRAHFAPRAGLYWADLLASALTGWAAFLLALRLEPFGVGALLAGVVAVLALYRAVLFIHELTHLKRGALPGFEIAWHLLVGFPFLAPSLLYVGSHGDHHRVRLYGTERDPEYETLAEWSALRLVLSTLGLVVVPAALVLRWAVFGPISWFVPPLRRLLVARLSTLVINARYERRAPLGRQRARWAWGELGCGLVAWLAFLAWSTGVLSTIVVAQWYAVTSAILLLNQVRTLAAHRYRSGWVSGDREAEFLDSINLVQPAWLMSLLAPVGLRYHALHHLIPTLPYHSLGHVDRVLKARLPESSPYRRVEVRGLGAALGSLIAGSDEGEPKAA
ncbi:MAG: fatty acid desaturase [Deltaproteobacteria bacterium]|nr:fatty acid desaturase [Deltaproteobacteria bacterium]